MNSVFARPLRHEIPQRLNRRRPAHLCPCGYTSYMRYSAARFSASSFAGRPLSDPGPKIAHSSISAATCGPSVGHGSSSNSGTIKTPTASVHSAQNRARIIARLRNRNSSPPLPTLTPTVPRLISRLNRPLKTTTRVRRQAKINTLQPILSGSILALLRRLRGPHVVIDSRRDQHVVQIRLVPLSSHRRRPDISPPLASQLVPALLTIGQSRSNDRLITRDLRRRRGLVPPSADRRILLRSSHRQPPLRHRATVETNQASRHGRRE